MAQRTNTDQESHAGANKPEPGTGIPAKVNDENMPNDERLTNEYTRNDEDVADGVRQLHPNRNADKGKEAGTGDQ